MATKMVPPKNYDPVKAMEGMFNGSVTRIAQALRDPVNYGASTKTVLTEVAKRFHDALDDCEIQLLDAKWYLEHQLEQNKSRRDAKAIELGTAAKRKLEEIQETTVQEETPTKNPKIEEEKWSEVVAEVATTTKSADEAASNSEEPKNTKKPEPLRPKSVAETPVQDDFAKPTPQVSPAVTNEDFNFESMFGEVTANGTDNDLGFDLGLDNEYDAGPDTNTLDALMPDLDNFTAEPTTNVTTTTGIDAIPAFSNDFDLPEIGSSNAFDDFLNDDSLEGDLGNNVDLSGEGLLDMDFDESLFN